MHCCSKLVVIYFFTLSLTKEKVNNTWSWWRSQWSLSSVTCFAKILCFQTLCNCVPEYNRLTSKEDSKVHLWAIFSFTCIYSVFGFNLSVLEKWFSYFICLSFSVSQYTVVLIQPFFKAWMPKIGQMWNLLSVNHSSIALTPFPKSLVIYILAKVQGLPSTYPTVSYNPVNAELDNFIYFF